MKAISQSCGDNESKYDGAGNFMSNVKCLRMEGGKFSPLNNAWSRGKRASTKLARCAKTSRVTFSRTSRVSCWSDNIQQDISSPAMAATPKDSAGEVQTLGQAISQPWVIQEIYGFLLVTAAISIIDFNILWDNPDKRKVLIAAGLNVAALAGYSISYDFRAKSRKAASQAATDEKSQSTDEKSQSTQNPSKETRVLIFGAPVIITFDRCLNLFSIVFASLVGILVYTRI